MRSYASALTVRDAMPVDIDQMHRVRLSVRENALTETSAVTPGSYARLLQAQGRAWVAEAGGEIAGFGVLDLTKANVWALFVDPHSECRGIGSALHQRAITCAAASGLKRLWLTTGVKTNAERFYFRRGWRDAGIVQPGERKLELYLSVNLDGDRHVAG